MTTATKGVENNSVSEDENYKFRITCSKFERYEAGAQIFIKYGKYSNRQLLIHYGFAMIENIYNYARIKIKLGYFLDARQTSVLGKGYSLDLFAIFKLRNTEFCTDLLKSFRSFSWNIDIHTSESFFCPSDFSLELTSLEKMILVLKEILSEFPTTIDQDLNELNNSHYKRYFAVFFT